MGAVTGTSLALAPRVRPAGLRAGARLTRVDGPAAALALVSSELQVAEGVLRDLVHSDVAEVPAIAGYLLDAGGKRLRPALTALGARAVSYDGPVERLMCVGELLHLGSLLHDDVVDEGALRRGKPAAYKVYGAPAAVLTGDFCLARAVLLAAEEGGFEAVRTLGSTVTEMAEGEVLQLKRAGDLGTQLGDYLDVIDRKSAALIAWCAAAGAWAKGDAQAAEALQQFGRGVGAAFQIADDVLDYAEGTGKAPGADLRERKVTLPLILAMQELPGLRPRLEAGPLSHDELLEWMMRIRASGALTRSLALAMERAQAAAEALEVLPNSDARDALGVLARYLVDRSR